MNKNINKILTLVIMFFAFGIIVDASSYNFLEGDIIIGNTVFHENTWISASRASKAGSLFTKNNSGNTDINIYYYVNDNVIYKYNDSEEKYNILSEDEKNSVLENLVVYYDNNNGLSNTYKINEEDGDISTVDQLINLVTDKDSYESDLNDSNVTIDSDNKTVTCPYDYEFSFNVKYNYGEEAGTTESYYVKCGITSLELLSQYEKNMKPVEIVSVKLATDSNFLNQNKVEYNENSGVYKIKDSLQEFSVDGKSGKYIVFDITLNDNNSYPEIYESNHSNVDVIIKRIDSKTIRCYVSTDTYNTYSGSFILVDGYYDTYKRISIPIMGKERNNYDLTVTSVKPSELENENNNQSKISELKTLVYTGTAVGSNGEEKTYSYNDYHYYVVGDMNSYAVGNVNSLNGYWIATDVMFNDGVDYNSLEVNISDSASGYYYEKLDDRLRFYISKNDLYGASFNSIYVNIYDSSTNGKSSIIFDISISIYGESDYISYNHTNHSIVEFEKDDTNGIKLNTVTSNTSLFYNIYYNDRNSKLYYVDNYLPLIKNEDGIKKLYKDVEGNFQLTDVFAVISRENYIQTISDADIDNISSNGLDSYIGDENTNIYYFFNRDKNEKETEFITALEELANNKSNITLSDISTSIYNEN